jgi:hypothetical protein
LECLTPSSRGIKITQCGDQPVVSLGPSRRWSQPREEQLGPASLGVEAIYTGDMTQQEERGTELRARALLQAEFGCELHRVPSRPIPTVDYRDTTRLRSVEVKQLTSEPYNDLNAAFRKHWRWDSSSLSGRWTVIIDQPTLSSLLEPVPHFPDDDAEMIAHYSAAGLTVTTKAEREAEWRANHPGPIEQPPRLIGLGPDLKRHLITLERHGINSRDEAWRRADSPELLNALRFISVRTGDAFFQRRDIVCGEKSGIDIVLAAACVRTGRADTVAERIDLWLASDDSGNLRDSLANESGTEHHAVLVLDASTEPEWKAAIHQGLEFCPTMPISLPNEIDVLWFIIGPVACRYNPSTGWRSTLTPDADLYGSHLTL